FIGAPLLIVALPLTIRATPTPGTYTLSLHDALPILAAGKDAELLSRTPAVLGLAGANVGTYRQQLEAILPFAESHVETDAEIALDRKSTRLNSSHVKISYAVFCLKKKKNKRTLSD